MSRHRSMEGVGGRLRIKLFKREKDTSMQVVELQLTSSASDVEALRDLGSYIQALSNLQHVIDDMQINPYQETAIKSIKLGQTKSEDKDAEKKLNLATYLKAKSFVLQILGHLLRSNLTVPVWYQ